jgi:(2Fe-2S) ferredoxin
MKFFLVSCLIAMLVGLAMASADQKPIVVSYPEGTPYSELEELKAAIEKVVSQMPDVDSVDQARTNQ